MTRLTASKLETFMLGQTLNAFDPDSHAAVASVTYRADGTCTARFPDGTQDRGQFGLSGDTYWTRYTDFRAGETHHFYLERVAPQVTQAYHADGRRAYLQSPLAKLDPPTS